jgi:hypothetical protein
MIRKLNHFFNWYSLETAYRNAVFVKVRMFDPTKGDIGGKLKFDMGFVQSI